MEPGVGNLGRENARAGRIEIVFLENGADGILRGVDVPARGARAPPIVFRHHDRAMSFDGRAKIGAVQRRPFDQKPRARERRPRPDFMERFLRQQRIFGAIHEVPRSDQRQRFVTRDSLGARTFPLL